MKKNAYLQDLWDKSQNDLDHITLAEIEIGEAYRYTDYNKPLTFDTGLEEYSKNHMNAITKILKKASVTEILIENGAEAFDILKAFCKHTNFKIKSIHAYGICLSNETT